MRRFLALLAVAFGLLTAAPAWAQMMLTGAGKSSPAVAVVCTTYDPSNKGTNIALTVGDLLATLSANQFQVARSTATVTSGLIHVEMTAGASLSGAVFAGFGIINGSFALNGTDPFSSVNAVTLNPNGNVYRNSVNLGTGVSGGIAAADVVAMEIDVPGTQVRFMKAGGSWSSFISYSALGGTQYVSTILFASGHTSLANFGASAFTITPSSGYVGLCS